MPTEPGPWHPDILNTHMGCVEPTGEQLQQLASDAAADDAPITMLNMLRFREQAAYPDDFDAEPCSGEQAYARYAEGALAVMSAVGGRPIWGAEARQPVIAPGDECWDQVFLVHYPSRSAFIAMATDPEYLAIVPHRSAALADSRLILCDAPEAAPQMFGSG